MVVDLGAFRLVVGIMADSGPKEYVVDYSFIRPRNKSASELHNILHPDDPNSDGNAARQARIDGWPQNRIDEYFASQPNLQFYEIVSQSKKSTVDTYSFFNRSGGLQTGKYTSWDLAVTFSWVWKDGTRETDRGIFLSEVEGADWKDHLPVTDAEGTIVYVDLRADRGPVLW